MELFNLLNNTNNNIITETIKYDNKITILLETLGKHKNTYILNWDIPIEDKKNHLKFFKKKYGCNGSIKTFNMNNDIIHLQGEHCKYVYKYLISLDIDSNKIEIK
jgi:translation initiation factor 1 (eIF-1/SUI1)